MSDILRRAATAALVFVCLAASGSTADTTLIPNSKLLTPEGQPFDLAGLKGKVVVFDFWATWCGPCIRELPELSALHKRYKDRGAVVVGVTMNSGPATKVAQFLKTRPLPYPVVMDDGKFSGRFGAIQSFPTTYLVGTDGRALNVWLGSDQTKLAELEAAVANALHRTNDKDKVKDGKLARPAKGAALN